MAPNPKFSQAQMASIVMVSPCLVAMRNPLQMLFWSMHTIKTFLIKTPSVYIKNGPSLHFGLDKDVVEVLFLCIESNICALFFSL